MSVVKRRIFLESFKREAVDRVATSGLSAGAPAPSPSDLVAEVARLRRDNDRLRMERDILKKPRSSSDRPPDEVRVRR